MTKPKRNYLKKTLKILFALSGNQCAHPGCTNALIEPGTEESDAIVIAHICHIYAVSEDGPRGKAGLTNQELNSHENLILLCRHHHAIVDGQHETYPADMLMKWKQMHESKIKERISEDLKSFQPKRFSSPYFPTELIDQKIDEEVDILRKSRYFIEFDRVRSTLSLARRLIEGELSGGSDAVRRRAIAWCARILTYTEKFDKAEEFLKFAKTFGSCPEIEIAHAFICSQKGNKKSALCALANIDAPISRSAALMIVAHHDGPEGAIKWLTTARIDARDLDHDGKFFLLTRQLELSRWDAAMESLDAVTDEDLRETPMLNHMVAITRLLSTVPIELRTIVLKQLPFEAIGFPLASDADAIEARREAHKYFIESAQIAHQLSFSGAARIDDEYALWLELKDPDNSDNGRKRLEEKLREPNTALRLVNLGLQFGITLDLEKVEREIERQIALHGGITCDAAIARFALAFTQKTPENVANYIGRHLDELAKFLDKKSLQFFQIEMFSRARLPERAYECLGVLVEEGLSEDEESRLRGIIAEAEGFNPLEARKEQFKKTDSLGDLVSLVDKLESIADWDGICEYGQVLFERTHSLHDAERLAISLSNTQKNECLVDFLEANEAFLAQSKNLQMLYCWSLYNKGKLLEARTEMEKLSDGQDNANFRALQVNLGIALGDWNSLYAFVAKECLEKDKRSAQDLIGAAQLALHLESPNAKELIFAAAQKGSNDAEILATAYFLASSAGWEDDDEVFKWIQEAAKLSGNNGPIQKMTLKDILDRKPEWDRRESETWELLIRGEIPIFIAAKSLNKSLINLMLLPALANLSENDPRLRNVVPAYSGKRLPVQINTQITVGIDTTALLSLSFLNLLDKTFDAFDTVYLPHSTLVWLFEEKRNATFHQPSRINKAHQVHHLLATNVLEKLLPSVVPDSDLSAQVGDGLALLIAEAEKMSDNKDLQRIVVRSSPVHRIDSLMEEEANLTPHAAVLSSCQSLVDKLRQKGQITAEEEKKARAFLQLHEKHWPQQPEIADTAILYLDDLTISYFLHLGILEKLRATGFRLMVSPKEVSRANELIFYESISDKVIDAIENIRSVINSRVESRKIKFGRQQNINESEDQLISGHPTLSLMALARDCDAIIFDDRFLNQHANINDDSAQVPIFSTLDLLDTLVSTGSITDEDRSEYKTKLRRAGYIFIPVSEKKLEGYLNASAIKDENVIETAELKAVRENILLVQMSNWLQLPKETPWLVISYKVFIKVLKGIWRNNADFSGLRARSDWIMNQVDLRRWPHSLGDDDGDNMDKAGRDVHILTVLAPPSNIPQNVKKEYWNWVEQRVLFPIKEQYPYRYSWIVDWLRKKITETVEMLLAEERSNVTNSSYVRSALAQTVLELAPPLIRQSLIENADFLKNYSLTTDAVLSFGDSGLSAQRSDLLNAIRNLFSGNSEVKVIDTAGQKWKLKNISGEGDPPKLTLSRGKQRILLPDFCALSSDRDLRLRALDEAAFEVNLPSSARDLWHNILTEGALEDDEIDAFHCEFRDTPINNARSIREEIFQGQSSISSLVPYSRKYFERLIGEYDGSATIRDYASSRGKALFHELSAWKSYEGFLSCLFLSSHSSLTSEINVDQLSSEDLLRAFVFLEKHGDRISQLGAIEIGLRIFHSRPEIEQNLIRLIELIRDDDVNEQSSSFRLLFALFILVDGELSRAQLFTAEPPFYRRLASLAQASLIQRQIANSTVDIDHFYKWAVSNRSNQYYLQSLVDMRLEPHWNPDLVVASQIKANFLGRIIVAAKNNETNIKNSELFDLVLATKTGSLYSHSDYFCTYLPVPLEGIDKTRNILPTDIAKTIITQLSAEDVGPSSFIALVNSALIFRVDSAQAELAAKALKSVNYRLANIENRTQLLVVLDGLATVAAVARSHILADGLRILVRRYRHDAQYKLSIVEAMKICLIAAASRSEMNDWREFVGDWLTELAFSDLEGDDGLILYSNLQFLCYSVPELWISCGRADAALMAYIDSRHNA